MLRVLVLALVASLALACKGAAADAPSGTTSAPAATAAPSQVTGSAASISSASALPVPASAAAAVPRFTPVDPAAARALAASPPRPPDGKGAGFVGPVDAGLDADWIVALASGQIVEVSPNKGGGSVSIKVKLADGKKAAMKLEQTGHPTDPRAEIAAYHTDRILGLGRTAVVVGRAFSHAELRAALVDSRADPAFLDRFDRLVVQRDGKVAAAMVAWHTKPLVEEEVAPAWAAGLETGGATPADVLPRLSEWSDLVLFDFLIDNPDRFSGGNVLRLDKNGPLVFLDQGAAFGKNRLEQKLTTRDRLDKVCRFRDRTIDALAAVSPLQKPGERLADHLGKSLAKDALAPVLTAPQLASVNERAGLLLEHVRACRAKLGAAITL